MERINNMPVIGNVLSIIDRYPRISAWIVLSVGIVGLLIYEARDVGLTTQNWIVLILASILISGLCIWIVSWEDDEETLEEQSIVVESQKIEDTSDE
ncbi:MAG: hypothetical protein L0154_20845 [Chloroflexi bacterium]|nr:hypothetical protein [Chloroflexota bacterium]